MLNKKKGKCEIGEAMHNSGKKPINQLVPGPTR